MRRVEHRTTQGDTAKSVSFIELTTEQFKVYGGIIRKITIPCSGNTSTNKYLAIYAGDKLVDVSTNALAQQDGYDSEWYFESLPKELPEETIKLILADNREGEGSGTIHCYTKDDVADVSFIAFMDDDEIDFRDIDIRRYWTPIVRQTAEFDNIAEAINPELKPLGGYIMDVLNESFILECSEYGVQRWEEQLGILYGENDTLDDRKARILTYFKLGQKYTWRALEEMVENIVGAGNWEMSYDNDTATLTIQIITEDEVVFKNLDTFLRKVLPQNIVLELVLGIELKFRQLVAHYKEHGTNNEVFTLFGGRLLVDNRSTVSNYPDTPAEYVILANATRLNSTFKDNQNITSLNGWYAPKATVLSEVFRGCANLKKLPKDMSLDNTTTLYAVFTECTSLEELPEVMTLNHMTHLTSRMFYKCPLKKLPKNMKLTNLIRGGGDAYWSNGTFGSANGFGKLTSLPDGMTLDNLEDGGGMFLYQSLTSLPKYMKLEKLTNGTYMFDSCNFTSLPKSMRLPNLVIGHGMFIRCKLQELPSGMKLSKLVNGHAMFYRSMLACDVELDMRELTNGKDVFRDTKITSFKGDLPKLENGSGMFYNTQNMTSFKGELPKLGNGNDMFAYSGIQSFDCELPELYNATNMFRGSKIKMFNCALPKCTNMNDMFRSSSVEEITITEHQTTTFSCLVYYARNCKKINMDFSNATSLSYFGEGCGLLEFKHNLENVTNCNNAFMQATANPSNKLVEFNSALPSCTTMQNGFYNRWFLTTCRYPIDVDGECIYKTKKEQAVDENGELMWKYLELPKLLIGVNTFTNCKLDKPTAVSILNSLQQKDTTLTSNTNAWKLNIGIHVDNKTDEEVLQAIANAEARGWTITVGWTGTATVATYSLRPERVIVYAKRTENPEGIYIDENGTRWDVDMGHYVTNTEGYTEYTSEEEALAGLTFCGSMLQEPEEEIHEDYY